MINQNKKNQIIPLILMFIIIIYGMSSRWTVVNNTVIEHPIRADAMDYFLYTKNLSSFLIYSRDKNEKDGLTKDALRSPGFPVFASLFYSGDNMNSVVMTLKGQTILQCITFIMLSIICWLSFGAWISVFISFLVWTHPAFMSMNTYFLTESLFQSSLILLLTSFIFVLKTPPKKQLSFIFLGVVLAVTALIRPTMEYYFLFMALVLSIAFRNRLQEFLPTLISFLVIIMAWKVRNYFSIGSFSDPTLMINGIYHGSYPDFMYNNQPESFAFPYRFDPFMTQYYEGVGKTLSLIWQRAVENPMEYLYWYFVSKQFYLWQWNIVQGQGDVFIYSVKISPIIYQQDLRFLHHLHSLLNFPMMLIGVMYSYYVVISSMLKHSLLNARFIIASLVVYASLFHVLVAPFPRYGIPFKMLVIIMFFLSLKALFLFIKKNKALIYNNIDPKTK